MLNLRLFATVIPFLLAFATPALAAPCGGDFNTFVANISREAAAKGISQSVISQALSGVTQDPAVLAFDRRQRYTFNKSFEQYISTRVGAGRINGGQAMLQRHASLLSRIEQQFGVPPEIDRGDLGAGDRFRQGRHGQDAGDPHAGDHGA